MSSVELRYVLIVLLVNLYNSINELNSKSEPVVFKDDSFLKDADNLYNK